MGFDDGIGHRMALLAMDQYGLMLSGLAPGLVPAASKRAIDGAHRRGGVPVWLPARMVASRQDIPAIWDVTSDSLAAWLAGALGAHRLVLVKSTDPPPGRISAAELSALGLTDGAFPSFIDGGGFDSWCIGPGAPGKMARALDFGAGPGTRITGRV